MPKKIMKKRRITLHRKRYHTGSRLLKNLKRGKSDLSFLFVLGLVVMIAIALGFGMTGLTIQNQSQMMQNSITCCDTGDGQNCHPIEDKFMILKIKGKNSRYELLKSNAMLPRGMYHLNPLDPKYYITGVPAGAGHYVYLSDVADAGWVGFSKCDVHGTPSPKMDIISGCTRIPDDELVYLCESGCEKNKYKGDKAIFSIYFRAADKSSPGIPSRIKNCKKPKVVTLMGSQHIVNLPSPSGDQDDLQMETFYVTNDGTVKTGWFAPYCKPAVYLYPEKESAVSVDVNPIGKMLVTTPKYSQSGWNVTAHPNGTIVSGGKNYDYLFYEAAIPDQYIILPNEGYVVAYSDLKTFLPDLVTKLGLNEKEKTQFSEYWLKALPESSYYQIKVVSQYNLNMISPLTITPLPKTLIRVTLHFTPLDTFVKLPEPKITKPQRDGFTVVEWGGIFKKDADHPFSCLM